MSDGTGIEWTHRPGTRGETWNPVVGCSIKSPGCANCYAMRMAARLEAIGVDHYAGTTQPSKAGAVWTGKIAAAPEHIMLAPLHWRAPRTIFVNSMGDLFHEDVPDEVIDTIFAIMALCPKHTFIVLTKRSDRMWEFFRLGRSLMGTPKRAMRIEDRLLELQQGRSNQVLDIPIWPLPNLWLGVSVERQKEAEERIPLLLATPAALRFVSAEPLLGEVELDRVLIKSYPVPVYLNSLTGTQFANHTLYSDLADLSRSPKLDWVIIGGESGAGARPMHPAWARSLRDQCAATGIAFFFKQWGEWLPFGQSGFHHWSAANRSAKQQAKRWLGHAHFNDGAKGPETHSIGPMETITVTTPADLMGTPCVRIGKARAGRLLDGFEHNAFPEHRG